MLSGKQGGIKYHFLSLWYDSTGDRTPVARTIGERLSTHLANDPIKPLFKNSKNNYLRCTRT